MRSQYQLYPFVTSSMQIRPSYSVFTLKLGHKSQTKQTNKKGQKLKLADAVGEFGAALIRTDVCIEPGTGKTTLIYFRKQRGHRED